MWRVSIPSLLKKALSKRLLVIVVALLVFGSSFFVWRLLGKEFLPPEDRSMFMVIFQSPVGSSIDYTDAKLKYNEGVLSSTPEIKGFFGAIGLGESASVNSGMMFVRMHPKDERERSQSEVLGELRGRLNAEPGMSAFPMAMAAGFGSHRGQPLEFIVKGPSLEALDKYSSEIVDRLKEVPGIVGIDTDFDLGLPEIKINIDRERASDLGVDITTLASTINLLIGGRDSSDYKEGGKRYDVRMKLDRTQRMTPSDIEKLSVRNSDGELVRLASIIDVVEGVSPNVINRNDRERSITISASLDGGKTLGSAIEDVKAIAKEVLPDGYTTKLGGSAEQFGETQMSMLFAFLMAILITYMVLASLFESFAHPFTVMLALPLSIVGALTALLLTGNTINIYSLIGITLLVGLVTKNSIILVDYTNRLRNHGDRAIDAVLTAGPVRLRPILMTAFSTIFGVLPTAVGIGPGSESRAPMAIATIGGLLVATLLTLFVIPVVYTLVDDLKSKVFKSGKG
ncbi:MAG: efflux RND transporter permease subunit [Deltaproteobacteria bacterium]|nr:efflux RND transporter permease subunit [Deltaproteobacteria bacterium]